MDKQRATIQVFSGLLESGIVIDVTDPSANGIPPLTDATLFAMGDVVLADLLTQSGAATHPNDTVRVTKATAAEIDRPE